jgi:hypothetical protein
MECRLAAIMVADIGGYSPLMEHAEKHMADQTIKDWICRQLLNVSRRSALALIDQLSR